MAPSSNAALLDRFGKRFPKGTVLFEEGEHGNEMYIVHSGKVRITRFIRGRTTILTDLGPGDFFGEMAILNNKPRGATATIAQDAVLLVIDGQTFLSMLRANADIALRMIQKLAARLDMANAQIEFLLVREPNHRVAYTLRRMAAMIGRPHGIGVLVPVTTADLSGKVGLPVEEVAEILKRLGEAKLVEQVDDGFVIPEVGKLAEYLEFLELRDQRGR